MGSVALAPRPAFALARDLDPRASLPYARHVTEQIVGLDTEALMLSFQLDGASFETADIRDLNDWHTKLNGAWRNLADDRLAVWHHLVRREHDGYPEGQFCSAFAAELDARYRARLGAGRMFVNELYVTLLLHPGRDAIERASAWLARSQRRVGHLDLASLGVGLDRDLGMGQMMRERIQRGRRRSGGRPTVLQM